MSVTTAAGKLPQQRYSGLGFQGIKMVHPPERLFGLICGLPGEGKSQFIQSHPDAWVCNMDCTSTLGDPQACVWPGINPQGQAIDVNGKPLVMTWEAVQAKVDLLCDLAKNDQPRPATVFFDSLGTWIPLLKDWITRSNDKKDWREMDGRRSWDQLYDMVIDTCLTLRRYGYGVYIVCHVVNAKIPLGDDRFVFKPELTITDGFYKRLYPLFEMVAAVSSEWVTEQREIQQPPIVKDGKTVQLKPKIVTEKRKRHLFSVDSETLSGITKHRVKMDAEFELPESFGWAEFVRKYNTNAGA